MQNATNVKVLPPPDRVKPYAQRSLFMVSIPVARALLCVESDCEMVYDSLAGACPKCGSRAALNVRCILERRSAA